MNCASDSCATGLQCHAQGANRYCSHACTADSDCVNHLLCQSGVCEFASGISLGAVGLHEDCTNSSCDSGLICVSVDSDRSYCFANCTTNHQADASACTTDESCHQLKNSKQGAIDLFACIQFASKGGTCSNPTSVCPSGQNCSSGICQVPGTVTPGGTSAAPPVASASPEGKSSCAQTGFPRELGLAACLLGILVPRRRRKC